MIKRLLGSLVVLVIALTGCAAAQRSVSQSGNVSSGHVPMWTTNGIIQDAGVAVAGFLTGVGVTAQGPGICQNSGPITGPYNQLCLSVQKNSAAQITLQNFGGAPAQQLQFVVNGTVIPLSGGLGNAPPASFIGNPTATTTVASAFPVTGLPTASGCVGSDYLVKFDSATGTLEKVTCAQIAGSVSGGVVGQNPSVVGQVGTWGNTIGTLLNSTDLGAIGYKSTGGNTSRITADRANDHGINIVDFGADPTGVSDSTAAIQAAIDYSYNNGFQGVYCPNGNYKTSYPLFLDQPGNLRGGAQWNSNITYNPGSVVTFNSTQYLLLPGFDNGAPGSPAYTGFGLDMAYQIVSSTSSVNFSPTLASPVAASLTTVTLKGSGITPPTVIIPATTPYFSGANVATTADAPAGSTIVVNVRGCCFNGENATALTDSAGNSYTKVASVTGSGTQIGNSLWVATNVTHLPIGGTITATVNSTGEYLIEALDTTTATGGVDKSASSSSPSTSAPAVATGVLSQANELVIGVANYFSFPAYTEAPGFTTTAPSLWSTTVAWNSGTTYASGAIVQSQGMLFRSLQNGNTNHIPTADLANDANLVWWTPTNSSVVSFSWGAQFYGPATQMGNDNVSGCVIIPAFNNSTAFMVGPGNGNTVDHVAIYNTASTKWRCAKPFTGAGIAITGDGGGSNRSKFSNIEIVGFYHSLALGSNTFDMNPSAVGLGAENKVIDPLIHAACIGIEVLNTEGFINYVIGGSIEANTEIWLHGQVGMNVYSGNYSAEEGAPATAFAASFSSFDGTTLTGTLTLAGDPYMLVSCAGGTNVFWDPTCQGNVYNAWNILTADFGLVPFVLSSFNPGSGAATWKLLANYLGPYRGSCCSAQFTTEITGAAKIYAAEMTRQFVGGGFTVDGIHIESVQPVEFIDATSASGSGRPNLFRNVFFNSDVTMSSIYLGNPSADHNKALFYAAQEFPFINTGVSNIVIDNAFISGEGQVPDNLMVDYSSLQSGFSGMLNIKGNFGVGLNFRGGPAINAYSSNYGSMYTRALGAGQYEITPNTGFNMALNGGSSGSLDPNNFFVDSTAGWVATPYIGVRPAPWTRPCIAPKQYADLQNLPAITGGPGAYSVPYPLLWSGQQYGICDWSLTPVAYNAGTTYAKGNLVTSASITYFSLVDSNTGHTPASSPTFWQPFHFGFVSNHGVGFSYGQNLTTTNVPSLSWSIGYASPFMNVTDPSLLFPGVGITLTSAGGIACTGSESFIVRESHLYLKYIALMDATYPSADVGGASLIPNSAFFPLASVCTGATIGQTAYSFTNLN